MKNWGLWTILLAVSINRFCSWLPTGVYFDPFPFYDLMYNGKNVGINLQSYCYIFTNHLAIILIWYFCRYELPKYERIFSFFITLEILSLFDFILIYEHPMFHLWSYGVEFTDIKLISYALLIISWKWK